MTLTSNKTAHVALTVSLSRLFLAPFRDLDSETLRQSVFENGVKSEKEYIGNVPSLLSLLSLLSLRASSVRMSDLLASSAAELSFRV